MDKLVHAIMALSGSETELKQLKGILNKEEATIIKGLPYLDDALSALNPQQNTLGYVHLLSARALAKVDAVKFTGQVQTLLQSGSSSQIRMAPAKFSHICRRFAEIAFEANQPIRAIKPLLQALKKLRPNTEALTPVHTDFLQACLLAKCYHAALPVLEEEIFDVNSDVTSVTPRDMLLYYYYGGLVYTGVHEFKKALDCFRMVITAPSMVLSAIMVEAYKKFVLISLLVHGKLPSLPRYTSSVIQRHHKTAFAQYHEFATAFATHSTDDLHKVAEQHVETFQKDKNFGLIKQCIQSLYRKNIQRFTQTYLTFSLKDIATGAKLNSVQEAEKQVLRMIESGEIFATINQKDGMVSFHEDPEQYDTNSMLSSLDQQVQKVIDLGKKVRVQDELIGVNPLYIQKTSLYERGGRGWNEFEEFEGAEKVPGGMGKLM